MTGGIVDRPPPGTGTGTIVFLHQTEQLLGGSQLERVVEIGATEDESGTYFETRLPNVPGFNRQLAQIIVDQYAGAINGILGQPYVTAIGYLQDVNQAGQLLDLIDIFWETPDGSGQGSIRVRLELILHPEQLVGGLTLAQRIQAAAEAYL